MISTSSPLVQTTLNRCQFFGGKITVLVVLLVLAGVVASAQSTWKSVHPQSLRQLRISMPYLPFTSSIVMADIEGRFRSEGIEVTIKQTPSGRVALDDLLAGDCDLIVCREIPVALAVMRQQPISVFASIAISEQSEAILVRQDRGISTVADLMSRRVGCVDETSSDYVLDSALDYSGMSLGSIQRIYGTPAELVLATEEGRLDAICIWTPLSDQLLTTLEGKLVPLEAGVLAPAYWNLVGCAQVDHDLVSHALRAIRDAGMAIERNATSAAQRCSKVMNISVSDLERNWREGSFALRLDQGLILALEGNARWAVLKGYAPNQQTPNFLDVMAPLPLVNIDPPAVSMIHPEVRR